MVKILDNLFYPIYEYLYLFVMVIYMAQMTPETARMVGRLSGDPIPLLIPIVLTIILLVRNPISFKNMKLWILTGILAAWTMAVCYKFHDYSPRNLSFYIFLFYAIFIAFIHVRVYGRDLFPIYEHIMVVFSAISLCLWGISVLFPETGDFFHQFPETANGNNVLYLYNWTDPEKIQIYNGIVRNLGVSRLCWQPLSWSICLAKVSHSETTRKSFSCFWHLHALSPRQDTVLYFFSTHYSGSTVSMLKAFSLLFLSSFRFPYSYTP